MHLADANGNHRESWDSRGSHWRTDFNDLARPMTRYEQGAGQPEQVVTRLEYGTAQAAAHNQYARLIRNDDGAGTQPARPAPCFSGLQSRTRFCLPSLWA